MHLLKTKTIERRTAVDRQSLRRARPLRGMAASQHHHRREPARRGLRHDPPLRAARAFPTSLRSTPQDKLVLSVMAGVTIEQMAKQTGARRVIRAMSSPAAELSLAYSPWCASPAVTSHDRDTARTLFEACGKTDEVANEDQIDYFTALTGPVPGFVAFFADSMIADAIARGVPKEDRRPRRAPALPCRGRRARQFGPLARRPCRGDDRLCRHHRRRHAGLARVKSRKRDRAGGSTPPISAPRPSRRPDCGTAQTSLSTTWNRKSLAVLKSAFDNSGQGLTRPSWSALRGRVLVACRLSAAPA